MITGKVTDIAGEPLLYANVFTSTDKGNPINNIGSITNYQGEYSIDVIPEKKVYITASYVGYERQTLEAIKGTKTLNFSLKQKTLPEVVITADAINWWQKNRKKIFIATGIAGTIAAITAIIKNKK